jgi:hypothetical protein
MAGPFKKIAVVQGVPSAQVQELFQTLAGRWQPSARLAGVVAEDHGLADRACSAGFLRSLGNGQRFPIFQDLGPGSTTCHLAEAGALAAADAVRRTSPQDVTSCCSTSSASSRRPVEGFAMRSARRWKRRCPSSHPSRLASQPHGKASPLPCSSLFPPMRTASTPGGTPSGRVAPRRPTPPRFLPRPRAVSIGWGAPFRRVFSCSFGP